MASLSDILTVAQNLVQAVSGVAQTYLNVQGSQTQATITAATLVRVGAGRLAMVSVTTAGAAGAIYDTNDAALTNNKIYTIPPSLGVVFVNLPVSYGIVVAPGAAQVVSVSYS